jgi:C1A family cysteine protease
MCNQLIPIIFVLVVVVWFAESFPKSKKAADDISWEEYKKQFGKVYRNNASEEAHHAEFLKTQKRVQEHNAKHHRGEKKYTLGIHHLADLLPQEKARMRGHRSVQSLTAVMDSEQASNNNSNNNDISYPIMMCQNFVPDPAAVIPDSVDWRTKGYVTPVKDQGQCGSCYSFSATGGLEGQLMRKTGTLPSLSEQNIIDCDPIDGGCNGGNSFIAWSWVNSNGGIDSEASYPYSPTNYVQDPVPVAGKCAYNAANVAGEAVGCSSVQTMNETAMKIAVATQGPISVSLFANFSEFNDFRSTDTFDDAICNSSPGPNDHAVLIVGYGTDSNGKDYWILKNSWNTNWGNEGYMNLVRGKNCIGIAQEPYFPLV